MTFLAVAWKGSMEDTASRAAQLLTSGNVLWGLDAEEAVFSAYGVPYQPVSVLITHDGIVKTSWAGAVGEAELRAELDALVATAG
ncbi:MAG: hypothetical protein OEY55_03140 [Acidimicrobiia bacterium]|nr:hypothetical protein [Acidimicrobiia bacterium]MDH5505016.1 hypothetical protein [Acidimicrobiia bacterium]